MSDILSKFFSFLKYLLLIVAFGLVFFGIISTYARLEKPLTDAINIFLPFVFVLVLFVANLFIKNNSVSKNLFFNFVCVMVFVSIIIICLRAMFDTNMLLFHKYGINYNPAFLSDNLSAVLVMLYMISGVNIILLISDVIEKKNLKK